MLRSFGIKELRWNHSRCVLLIVAAATLAACAVRNQTPRGADPDAGTEDVMGEPAPNCSGPASECGCPTDPVDCAGSAGTACVGGELVTCVRDALGCLSISSRLACPSGKPCTGAAPSAACTCLTPPASCAAGAGAACNADGELINCALDGDECLVESQNITCPMGKPCAGAHPRASCSCDAPPAECQAGAGTFCTKDGKLSTCGFDGNGCLTVTGTVACPAGKSCQGAAPSAACQCPAAPVGCAGVGSFCGSQGVSNCGFDASGCLVLTSTVACESPKTCVGSFPDGRCLCPALNAGAACGSCDGIVQCDGSCSKQTPPGLGTACGCENKGQVKCDGSCSVAGRPDDCTGACEAGKKACGSKCIANSSCCTATDCASVTGKVSTCNANHACSYICPMGQSECSDSVCRTECTAPTVVSVDYTALHKGLHPNGVSVTVFTDAKIVIQFSEAMDTVKTAAAFVPSNFTAGAITWSRDSKTMTVAAEGLQLGTIAGQTRTYKTYAFEIRATAADAAGNQLTQAVSHQFFTMLAGTGDCSFQASKSGEIYTSRGRWFVGEVCDVNGATLKVGDPSNGSSPNVNYDAFISFFCPGVVRGFTAVSAGNLTLTQTKGFARTHKVNATSYAELAPELYTSASEAVTTFTTTTDGNYEIDVRSSAAKQLLSDSKTVQFRVSGALNQFACGPDLSYPKLAVSFLY